MGSAVEFIELSKSYGDAIALSPTSFPIAAGEFFSIIGPSGSGKSTMLGITAGFLAPSGGAVMIDGRDIVAIPPYKRNIGMVFQNYALFPFLTVAENIAFPMRMRGVPKSEQGTKVARIMDAVRLTNLGDRKPSMLSGGQQQRVALARAAVYDPATLLMDEPLGALDKNLREEMQEEIKGFQTVMGATVMYVTHDQNEATSMSNRIAVMSTGKVEQIGTPQELYLSPKNTFVASFLGEANLSPVRSATRDGPGKIRIQLEGGMEVVSDSSDADGGDFLLTRPEAITLSTEAVETPNCFKAKVTDVVYTSGTAKYKVSIGSVVLHVKVTGNEMFPMRKKDEEVFVSWLPSRGRLIGK